MNLANICSTEKIVNKLKHFLSFLIPVSVVLFVMFLRGMWPFGDKSTLLWDMEIQYINIYNWYHNVLHGSSSLFYDFSKSLGGNMYGVFATYMSSPICLLVYFFSPEKMPQFITLATLLKIGLSGLAMNIYLTRRFDLSSNMIGMIFSVSYALMEYNVGLCSNLHFLDAMYMLPIVALGTYYLVKYNKKSLFIISVSYMIICNWYIGYMACFFIAFYFLFELIICEVGNRLYACVRFAYSAVLGALISSVTLIPSLMATTGGKAEVSVGYLLQGFHCDFFEPLKGLLLSSQANTSYESPAIYVGGFVLVIVLLGLFDTGIPMKTKITCISLVLVVYLSFSFVPLEVVWSALKKSYSFFFRNSFVFSFALVVTAATFYEKSRELTNKTGTICSVILMSCYGLYGHYRGFFPIRENVLYFILLLTYIFMIPDKNKGKGIKYVKTGLVTVLLLTELICNTDHAFERYRINCSEYFKYTSETNEIISKIQKKERDFYRLEKTFSEMDKRRGANRPVATEGLTYNYNAITHYSSLVDTNVNEFLFHTGYKNSDITQANYVDSNPVMDSLLGVRYLLSTHNEPLMEEVGDGIIHDEKVVIYENRRALKLITAVESGDYCDWNEDPFVTQQGIINAISGSDNNIFKRLDYRLQEGEGWIIDFKNNGPVYIYMDGDRKDIKLFVNDKFIQYYFTRFNNNVLCLGEYKEGDSIKITFEDSKDICSDHKLYAYMINIKDYEAFFEEYRKKTYNPDIINDTYVKYIYDNPEAAKLMLTIPYDAGWTVLLDEKEYEPQKAFDIFYLIDMPGGKHVLEMSYTPPFFKTGCVISLVGLLILTGIIIREKSLIR